MISNTFCELGRRDAFAPNVVLRLIPVGFALLAAATAAAGTASASVLVAAAIGGYLVGLGTRVLITAVQNALTRGDRG